MRGLTFELSKLSLRRSSNLPNSPAAGDVRCSRFPAAAMSLYICGPTAVGEPTGHFSQGCSSGSMLLPRTRTQASMAASTATPKMLLRLICTVTHSREIGAAQDDFRASGFPSGGLNSTSLLPGKRESQDQCVFVGVLIVRLSSTSFHKRPLFIKCAGRVIRFPHFQVNLNATTAARQIQELA